MVTTPNAIFPADRFFTSSSIRSRNTHKLPFVPSIVTRVVVDDDAFVRRLLSTLLGEQEISVVAEAADGDEVMALVETHRPDVVVLDLRMQHMDGLDTLRALRAAGDETPVVMLSAFGSDDAVLQAFRAGAAGFFSKDDDPEHMAAQVRLAALGKRVAGATATDALVRASISATPQVRLRSTLRCSAWPS